MMKIEISNKYDDGRRTLTIGALRMWWPFPVSSMLNSSAARVLGWPIYGAKAPWLIKRLFRIFRAVHNGRLWLRYRLVPAHQYHVVRTDLKPGYYDIDTIMLHACMTLVIRYVEDEMGGEEHIEKFSKELRENVDPNGPGTEPDQADRQDSALDVYRWWKYQRPKDRKRRDALLHILYGRKDRVSWAPTDHPQLSQMVFKEFEGDEIAMNKEFRALEQKIDDDEDRMLHRVIDLRRGMWT